MGKTTKPRRSTSGETAAAETASSTATTAAATAASQDHVGLRRSHEDQQSKRDAIAGWIVGSTISAIKGEVEEKAMLQALGNDEMAEETRSSSCADASASIRHSCNPPAATNPKLFRGLRGKAQQKARPRLTQEARTPSTTPRPSSAEGEQMNDITEENGIIINVAGDNTSDALVVDLEEQTQSSPLPASLTRNNSGLVEALPVTDDGNYRDHQLLEAQQVDQEELSRKSEIFLTKKKKERQCRIIGYILIAKSVIVITIALALIQMRKSSITSLEIPTAAPSIPPSASPSLAPTGELDMLLLDLPYSTRNTLNNITTPQWKGYDWLTRHPDLTGMPQWRKVQLFALATFFFAFEGPNWRQEVRNKWLLYDVSECYWFSGLFGRFRIDSEEISILQGVPNNDDDGYNEYDQHLEEEQPCNEAGVFQKLELSFLGLLPYSPFVPPEIALLTSLSVMTLASNELKGPLNAIIPSELYQMTQLTKLDFGLNFLTSSIPTEVGLLSNLTELAFAATMMTGTIPTELGLTTKMSTLWLAGLGVGLFSGTIPTELLLLTDLSFLVLSNNALVGTFPLELAFLPNMRDLWLGGNMITGSLATQLGLLADIHSLWLDNNPLFGTIPSQVGLMTSMTWLDLFSSRLTGTLPTELGLMTGLVKVRAHNQSLDWNHTSSTGSFGYKWISSSPVS